MQKNLSDCSNHLLELKDFGVAVGQNVVLNDISFTVPERGITILTGPKGNDKSLLLHTLTGRISSRSFHREWGEVRFRGAGLAQGERPALVAQSAQLMMSSVLDNVLDNVPDTDKLSRQEKYALAQGLLRSAGLDILCNQLEELKVNLPLALQRHLSIYHAIASNSSLICIDDVTKGLSPLEISELFAYLKEQGKQHALLIVLHNPQHVRLLGGHVIHIVNGRLHEKQTITGIFDNPRAEVASEFTRTGESSAATLLNASAENSREVAPVKQDEPIVDNVSNVTKASEINKHADIGRFLWLKRGFLAGTPAPGVRSNIDEDLKTLQSAGVTTLITVAENKPDDAKVKEYGLKNIWEPIPPMEAPSHLQAINICKHIESLRRKGEVIAIQGHSGLGRTGTVLAAYLLWEGMKLNNALDYVRRVEPRWARYKSQIKFLQEFSERV